MTRRLLLLLSTAALACGPAPGAAPPPVNPPVVHTPPPTPETSPESDPNLPEWVLRAIADQHVPGADHAVDLSEGEHVVVTRTHVIASGQTIASVDQIAPGGRLQRIDALFEHMKRVRQRFKDEHPNSAFHGAVTFWIHPETSAAVVKSVFQTCAFAGFPNASFGVRRRSDGRLARLPADALVPGPPGTTSSSGRLPPEVIQRVVRASYGEIRKCYEKALVQVPDITGKVVVRFVIGRDGKVSNVEDHGSTFPNPDTAACVIRAFGKLQFPAPEGGIVTVVYPILFAPE